MCTMWSCSFLPSMQYAIHPIGSRRKVEVVCCYCNDALPHEAEGKVNSTLLKDHLVQHNFRSCNQRLYFTGQSFRQHLQDNHRASHDMTLFAGWTLLLKAGQREKPSIFCQTEAAATPPRRADTDSIQLQKHKTKPSRNETQASPANFMDLTDVPWRPEPNKLRRKSSTVTRTKTTRHTRSSTEIFTRSATEDLSGGPTQWSSTPTESRDCPSFYRKRLDASTRNRLYVRAGDEALTGTSEKLFRRLPGSVLGVLMLRASLVAAVPARLTNSVDIYPLP
jgi:hypothetical protein